MEKIYKVINSDESHEYTIVVNEIGEYHTKYSLFYSNNSKWSELTREKLALSIEDDGNGVIFSSKFKELDYSQLLHIRILIEFESKYDDNLFEEYSVVEEKLFMKI